MNYLVQLLLPLSDNAGAPIPRQVFDGVRETLLQRFGGLTAYSQAPASGLWKDDMNPHQEPVKDVIVVYEVMVPELDRQWWMAYRKQLSSAFGQKELVIRAHKVNLL